MPVDLPEPGTQYGSAIGQSTPCRNCEYDLKGLKIGGTCPECGTAITPKRSTSRAADNLTDAPKKYLRPVAIGLTLLPLSIVGLIASIIVIGIGNLPASTLDMTFLGAVGMWTIGVWLVTSKRIKTESTVRDRVLDSDAFRMTVRLTMLAPIISGLFAVLLPNLPIISTLVDFVTYFAVVVLAIYLSNIADWAGDVSLGDRLRAAAWLMVVFGVLDAVLGLIGAVSTGLAPLAGILGIWTSIISLIGLVIFGICIFQLAMLGIWALNNAKTGQERDLRVAQRRAQEDAERVQRISEMAATTSIPAPPTTRPDPEVDLAIDSLGEDDPIPLIDDSTSESPGIRHDRDATSDLTTQKPKGDADIYELAPEDDESGRP